MAGTAVQAQEPASLRGRVADTDGRHVAAALIAVRGTSAYTLSDSAGRFSVTQIPPGEHVIVVTQLGYSAVQLRRTFAAGAVVQADVLLQLEPLRGDTITAAAPGLTRLNPQLEGFHERRSRGNGYFYTRTDIARMQPQLFTDVLRRVPGMHLQPVEGPYGTSYVVQLRRATGASGARPCPVLFVVNGVPFPVSADVGINTFIRPEDVAAVEVYSGAAGLPPQFSSTGNNSRCGVVVIWTGNERGAPGGGRDAQ